MFGEQPTPAAEPAAPEVSQPADQAPAAEVAELFKAAGLTLPGSEQPAAAPEAAPPMPETAPEGEPQYSQQEMMQAYMQQQAELSQQMVALQQQQAQLQGQQYAPAQQPAGPNLNDPSQLADMMNAVGLDPSSAEAVFMFRADVERRQQQHRYEEQITQLQNYIHHSQQQQYQAQSEQSLAPQVDATLQVYGDIPAEISENIKHHAATILSEGLGATDEAHAIHMAVQPYLPLLQMVKQTGNVASASQPQTPPTQAQVAASKRIDAQAVLAAALSGGSSGHGPSLDDLDVSDLEKALFRNN